MSKIILPKKFIDRSPDGKYKHLNGKNKISYSQWTSWKSIQYRPSYIKQYIVGIPLDCGIFAQAGTDFGSLVEWKGMGEINEKPICKVLNQIDTEKIVNNLNYPENSIYEDYVVLDMGDFVIEGYADRIIYDNKNIIVEDFKTGSLDSRKKYESDEYMQTNLYSYIKETEGYIVNDCKVLLFERKGNGSAKSPMRLTGEQLHIPTPYCREKTEIWLEDVKKTVIEISDYYQKYLKLFK